ncbi:MAG TPA: sigma 54-interacting transcriptional regulator [Polyangiaceae bacterium]|nr:sigma 54-interacting transcriptional regulator [Polyangiaceae bacterium]
MTSTTSAMQQYGIPASPESASRGGTSAGLVLLYSQSYKQLQPAYPLTTSEVFIGRDPLCAIVVPERAVSRHHAMLKYNGESWLLRALGGANGTMVDGHFIDEIELEHLHEIRVGDTVMKFVLAGAENYMSYGIDGAMVGSVQRRSTRLTELVGGWAIDRIGAQLERIAPLELLIVIQGESGTGKEVVAREIHRLSGRAGPLRAVNCAAIPPNLIESELFGYKRGAFSGAERDKLGLIPAANHGTLLLDEIGDMPLEAQAKLLRVIQSGEIYPVGATTAQHVNVRFICATNRNLPNLVKEGRFRGDLLARLNEFSIELPPLRERKEEIFQLSRTLIARHGHADKQISFPFMLALLHYDWPYNVRELEACLRRAVAIADTPVLDPRHLPDCIREAMVPYGTRLAPSSEPAPIAVHEPSPAAPASCRPRASAPSEQRMRELLAAHRGNVAAVGRELGKERMQIHRWMQRYGIVVDEYRR